MNYKNYISLGFVGCCLLLFSSCLSKRYLQDDEYFLKKHIVQFEKAKIAKDFKDELEEDLLSLTKPKPNSKIIWWRYSVWLNSLVDEPKDTSNIDKWIERKLAEAPSLISKPFVEDNQDAMQNYLKNRGFFQSEVGYSIDSVRWRRHGTIVYEIDLNKQYLVDSFNIITRDSTLKPFLPSLMEASVYKDSAPLDNQLYNKEVGRIAQSLRNQGFAYFFQNNIGPMLADSIADDSTRLRVNLELLRPDDASHHKRYRFGAVSVLEPDNQVVGDTLIDGISYQRGEEGFTVRPKYLDNLIKIRPGNIYSQAELNRTVTNLNNLGVYKFVSIKANDENPDDDEIDFDILVSRAKKRLLSLTLEGNYTRESIGNATGARNFLGNSLGLRYRIRNINNTATQVDLNANVGVEFNFRPDSTRLINIFESSFGTDILIPRFVEIGTFSALKSMNWLNEAFYDKLKDQSKTHIVGSVNFQDRLNLFQIVAIQLAFLYDFTPKPGERWTLSQAGVNYAFNSLDSTFESQLDEANLLASFDPYIISGILFKDLTYTKTNPSPFDRLQKKFQFNFELSGMEMLLVNVLANGLTSPISIRGIPFNYYLRAGATQVYDYRLTSNTNLVLRGDFEFITPISGAGTFPPYFKLPFVGGPFSLRGWLTRGLGPGQTPIESGQFIGVQVGDLKLEANAELRFKLLWLLQGAIFFDAGNVYTLKGEEEGRFSSNFHESLALNTGFGFRLKLPYFVLRWDIGVPLRYPSKLENGSNWVDLPTAIGNANFGNIALGFPF